VIRSHALHPDVLAKARKVLQALSEGKLETWMVAHAREVLPSLQRAGGVEKAPIPSVAHHDQVRASEETAEERRERKVYRQVARRDRVCQIDDLETFGPHGGKLEIDHQHGRGKAPTTAESCRRLCARHHQMKTDGAPSRLAHLLDFLGWATRKRYWGEVEKTNAEIALERAQRIGRPA
jgi:hypothetical protein